MKAINARQYILEGHPLYTTLPDDIITCLSRDDLRLCFSASVNLWFLLQQTETEPFFIYHDSGSWLDCAEQIKDKLWVHDVPFLWGKPIKSRYTKCLQYIPFYETVETGREYDDGFPITEQRFYILQCGFSPAIDDNIIRQNSCAGAELLHYETDLFAMIRDLSILTGEKFLNGYKMQEEG